MRNKHLATFTQNLKVLNTTGFFFPNYFVGASVFFFCPNTEDYLGLRGWCPCNYLVWIGLNKGTTLAPYHCLGSQWRVTTLHWLLVGCLKSQQNARVSQGRICSDNCTCCHTETEVADPTFHLTQSQYTDTGPTSPSTDPLTPGAWQGSHWSANV